jgi:alkaline phosphatase D
MLGAVYHDQVLIWCRASGPFQVEIEFSVSPALGQADLRTASQEALKSNDYSCVIRLDQLIPETRYYYRVRMNGETAGYFEDLPPFSFKTGPLPGTRRNFRVAFGSCPRVQADPYQRIWQVVHAFEPDIFFWLGDNIYGDALDPDILREEYRRQRSVAALQPALRTISNLALWDDHDFGLNDYDRRHPGKAEALQVFKDYWANPSYGLSEVPGVFFRHTFGAVDFFFLDVRYYRDPNESEDTPHKTMLGKQQLQWLQNELQKSQSLFKILVSGSGWSNAKGPGGDSWSAFLHERNRLFDWIRDANIAGVVFLSGDTHVGELNVIPWSDKGGYDYYDLVSSPLAQKTSGGWLDRRPERRVRPVYYQGPNFGVIDFSFDNNAELTFNLVDDFGRTIWKAFHLRADELSNGIQSWPHHADQLEMQRLDNYEQKKGYDDR